MKGTNPFPKRTASESPITSFYDVMYMTGVFTIIRFNKIKNKLVSLLLELLGKVGLFFANRVKQIKSFLKSVFNKYIKLINGSRFSFIQTKQSLVKRKGDTFYTKALLVGHGAAAAFKVLFQIFLSIFKIGAPILATFILINTVNFFLQEDYAVEVNLYDQNIGYIKNEGIFEIAEKDMQSDIKYQEGEDIYYTTPTYRIVTSVNEEELMDSKTLRNEMIKASGEEISEAWGFYVNNQFYGAISNDANIKIILDEKLKYQMIEGEDAKVEYLQDIKLEHNIYLKTSIYEEAKLTEQIDGEVIKEESYIVKSGDTPSGIASSLGMRLAELEELNPNIRDNFTPGKELIIKNNKPFLSIKKTTQERYEEEIPFEKESVEDSTMYKGDTKEVQKGKAGVAAIHAEIIKVDGVKIEEVEKSRKIISEPVTQKTKVGTKNRPVSGSASVSAGSIPTASGRFMWPVKGGGRVTNGWYGYAGHAAIDIQSFSGDAILAADAGTVTKVAYLRYGYGYHVIITHSNGYQTLYAHNSSIDVVPGQQVSKGQTIARQGRTGRATGVHLHFEIIYKGTKVNPSKFF